MVEAETRADARTLGFVRPVVVIEETHAIANSARSGRSWLRATGKAQMPVDCSPLSAGPVRRNTVDCRRAWPSWGAAHRVVDRSCARRSGLKWTAVSCRQTCASPDCHGSGECLHCRAFVAAHCILPLLHRRRRVQSDVDRLRRDNSESSRGNCGEDCTACHDGTEVAAAAAVEGAGSTERGSPDDIPCVLVHPARPTRASIWGYMDDAVKADQK
jgi:hypothetical protein